MPCKKQLNRFSLKPVQKRFYFVVCISIAVFSAITLLALMAWPAGAQLGTCPTNAYNLGEPSGFWPADLLACAYNQRVVSVRNDADDYYPCAQYIAVNEGDPIDNAFIWDIPGWSTPVVFVPDSAQWYGDTAHVRALLFGRPTPGFTSLVPPGSSLVNDLVRISYYNTNENRYSYVEQYTYAFDIVSTWYDDGLGFNHYYQVYLVDLMIPTSEPQGGYFTLEIYFDDTEWPTVERRNYGVASFRLGSNSDTLPAHCPIPNADLPATPPGATPTGTLQPTWTPNPTYTVTPTPVITPGATAAGITPFPTVTLTPFVFPTVPAESTPTPWPPYALPTISWPTRDAVIVPGAATVDSVYGGITDTAGTINSDWQTPIAFAADSTDTTLTTTTGYMAPVSIAVSLTTGLALPISYVKGMAGYFPNMAPYLTFLLAAAAWILFMHIAKLLLQVSAFVFNLLTRLWDVIPFT